eukprot:306152_1
MYRIPTADGMDAVRAFNPNTAQEVINLNKENPDGTTARSTRVKFQRGDTPKVLAYGTSDKGPDWTTIHFLDLNTLEKLPDVVEQAKFTDVIWSADNKGVFYSGYGNVARSKATETT